MQIDCHMHKRLNVEFTKELHSLSVSVVHLICLLLAAYTRNAYNFNVNRNFDEEEISSQ